MESKKNPKADISRNASLYFAIGLALMVFLSYMTINWKVYDRSAIDIGLVNMDELDDEEIPLLEQVVPPPPPPPPPAAPEVIEIVEDEEEVEETVIESTETDQEEEMEIEDLSGRQRISVIFKIDKNGDVVGVRARAPHPRLVKEATRVVNLLPKMKPGKQRGKAVVVPYSLPIIFQVQD